MDKQAIDDAKIFGTGRHFCETVLAAPIKVFAVAEYIQRAKMSLPMSPEHSRNLDKFSGYLTEARPFIFHEGFLIGAEEMWDNSYPSLPFPVCSFEVAGRSPLWRWPEQEPPMVTLVSLVKEVKPGEITFCEAFVERGEDGHPTWGLDVFKISEEHYSVLNGYIRNFRPNRIGFEKVNFRAKVRVGGEKKCIKINRVIHVAPNKAKKDYAPGPGRKVEWSHCWEVMGHWRKVQGIGKDRFGQYNVEGMTWVVPHEKGPKHERKILKTRLVSPSPLVGTP